jgi:hypothetical protein
MTPRCAERASHKIKINRRRATKEIIDPAEDKTFHFKYVSG